MCRVLRIAVTLTVVGTLMVALMGSAKVSPSQQTKTKAKQEPKIIYHFPDAEEVPEYAFLPSELEQVIAHDTALVLIDMRSPTEFAEGHIPGSRNIPSDEITKRISELRAMQNAQRNMVLISRDGKDAYRLLKRLLRQKFDRVWFLYGGIEAWRKSGKTVISN
ncbi:MAG: hypothetical protein KatS3mg038_1075 [Candidatus Kapaibacterium sp.]|nr:MAG: hypothetical protein KatS3mg038_1075 [Candidatus Kapabacteria bacterium]GIV56679.1 MAG: hypothetical protein KatS3mg040_1447 [Candidatus Kapabacteria bacterium]